MPENSNCLSLHHTLDLIYERINSKFNVSVNSDLSSYNATQGVYHRHLEETSFQ